MSWSGEKPSISIEIIEDRTSSSRCDEGFLRIRRLLLRNAYSDGTQSDAYRYDLVERDALDAVAIVLVTRDGRVCLRSALRPPLAFRSSYAIPVADRDPAPILWEVPAGLVEPDEHGEEGLRACAARETEEEVGLRVDPSRFEFLGPSACLSPGVLAEKIHFLVAEVDPDQRSAPTLDGTPVEERAEVVFVPIEVALLACEDGRVGDVKTETAIHRLARRRRA